MAGGASRRPARRRPGGRRGNQDAWLYVVPALLAFGVFIAYPIVANVVTACAGRMAG